MSDIQITITNDLTTMDLDMVSDFIRHSYWGQGRSRAGIEKALRHSLCFGLFADQRQVGFARVVSDRAYFAYIFDLFVIDAYRGRGLGKVLTKAVLDHEQLKDVTSFMLSTKDAHGLYEPFGFETITDPNRIMTRVKKV